MTPAVRRFAGAVLGCVLCLASVWFLLHGVLWRALSEPGVDFHYQWDGATAIVQGRNPYAPEAGGQPYPVFTGILLSWLAAFPFHVSEGIWDVLGFVWICAGILVLAFGLRPGTVPDGDTPEDRWRSAASRWWPLLVVFMVAAFEPLRKAATDGNIDPLNFFLCSLFLWLATGVRERAAGVVLAVFTLVKIAPLLLVLPLAALGRKRTLAAYAATLALYGLFLAVSGTWRWEVYLFSVRLPGLPFQWHTISFSVHRFVGALLLPEALEERASFARLVLVVNMIVGVAYVALLALWRARDRRTPQEPGLLLALGCAMLTVFSPLLELIHFSWVLPALFLQLRAWIDGRIPAGVLAILAAAWSMAYLLRPMLHAPCPFPTWMLQSATMLLLALAAAWAAFRTKSPGTADAPSSA